MHSWPLARRPAATASTAAPSVIRQRHARARFGQPARDRGPEALPRAGHEGRSSGQREHGARPWPPAAPQDGGGHPPCAPPVRGPGGADAAFAQLVLLHLAVLGARQIVHEVDVARHAKYGRRASQKRVSSTGVEPRCRPRTTSAAITSSSASSERTGKTAAAATPGWLSSTCSTSKDEMFSPRRRIASLMRSTKRKRAVGVAHHAVAGVEPAGCARPRRSSPACRSSRSRRRRARRRAAAARRRRPAAARRRRSSTTRASKPGPQPAHHAARVANRARSAMTKLVSVEP